MVYIDSAGRLRIKDLYITGLYGLDKRARQMIAKISGFETSENLPAELFIMFECEFFSQS